MAARLLLSVRRATGGGREIGQASPVKEHTVSFNLPTTGEQISWTSEYGEDLGRTNFNLLALHVLNGTPYLVTEPNLCLSYNKWGRPNPPYVFFKYDDKVWQRIALAELPAEFKTINLIVNNGREKDIEKAARKFGYVPTDEVQNINSSLRQPEYKTILRKEIENAGGERCSEMIRVNDGWEGLGFFKLQASYEACLKYCDREGVNQQNCPCRNLFKGKRAPKGSTLQIAR